MDTSTNTKFSAIYYQTRNTRRAHNTTTMHNIDKNMTHLISNTHIGSFDTEHKSNNNFLVSRNNSTRNTCNSACNTCSSTRNTPGGDSCEQ